MLITARDKKIQSYINEAKKAGDSFPPFCCRGHKSRNECTHNVKKSSFFSLFSQFVRVSENPISYLIQFLEDAFEFIL